MICLSDNPRNGIVLASALDNNFEKGSHLDFIMNTANVHFSFGHGVCMHSMLSND